MPREGPVRSTSSTNHVADRGGGPSSDDDFSLTRPNPRDPEPFRRIPGSRMGQPTRELPRSFDRFRDRSPDAPACVRRNETGPRVWRGPAWVFVP